MDSTILEALYKYTYEDDEGSVISFNQGERFILLNKSSEDWWKVQRTGVFSGKSICYVPASYVKEINITPRGKSGFVNQYVNMDVYRKIMKRDVEGLARLGNQSMVVTRQNNAEVTRKGDQNEEEDSEDDVSLSEEDDDDDDEAFDPSLDDIPSDLRSLKMNSSSDMSPEPKERLPSLTFDISPRNERMKSFTLPANRSKPSKSEVPINTARLSTFQNDKKVCPKKPPRVHSADTLPLQTQGKVDIPTISTSPISSPVPSPDLPTGWTSEADPINNESIYINSVTKERWKSCLDTTGRTYYYNLDGPGTAWNLPELSDSGRPRNLRRKSFDETLEGVIRRQTIGSRSPRTQKCQSVMVRSPSSLSSDEGKSTSKSPLTSPKPPKKPTKPTNHKRTESNQSFEKMDMKQTNNTHSESDLLSQGPKAEKTGQLMRRKVVEGRKPVKKPVWTPVFICKYDSNLVFYKDQKSASPKPGFPTGKPESSLDLHGASLDHISKEKVKGKKFVFQIASYGSQNVHQFVADNQRDMGEWIVCIQSTISRLEEQEPLPPHPLENSNASTNGPSERVTSPSTLQPDVQSNTKQASPLMPKKLIGSSEKGGFKGFSRKLSKRVASHTDDDTKDKTKIRDKLKKYLSKRPSFTELEDKGIITDFVFGYPIDKLCERQDTLVPKFIVDIVFEVEKRGLDVDGIYRVSGNLSTVNKLRGLIDNGETVDYSAHDWNDIHILTGCLKLYFRELPEPLIPFRLFDRFIGAMKSPFKQEKIKLLCDVISEMKAERKETLNLLITHFQKVISHCSQNRMQAQNIAIIFGPTLLWPEVETLNMAMSTVFQNQVIEFLLQEWHSLYFL